MLRERAAPRPWPDAPSHRELATWIRHADLPRLPSFVTAEQFLDLIAQRRGRPIRLVESAALPTSVCGLWLATEDTDTIVVDQGLTGPRRDLVILHEAAHVLFAHHGTGTAGQLALFRLAGDAVPTGRVGTAMARSHFDDEQERQAEWLATYLLTRTRRLRRASWVGHPSSRYAARLLNGHG